MIVVVLLLVLLILGALGVVGIAMLGRTSRGRWLSDHTARRVIVHTTEGQSIEGLLTTNAPDGLVLTAAIFLDASAESVQLAGTIWVPRSKVAFLQVEPQETGK